MRISLCAEQRHKRTSVDKNVSFTVGGTPIPALKRTDEFKYLGGVFNGNGRGRYLPPSYLSGPKA